MPKRLVSKIDFIRPDKNEKERQRLLKYITEENLPVIYGGKSVAWMAKDGSGTTGAAEAEAEADAAAIETLKNQAQEDGNESEEFEEIYDDVPI